MNWNDLAVHHIGIVVDNIDEAKKPYETVFGMEVVQVYDVEAFAAKVAFLPVKNTYIELVQPTNPDDGLGRFLKNGGGLHHICYIVDDIDAAILQMFLHRLFERETCVIGPKDNAGSLHIRILRQSPSHRKRDLVRCAP